MRAIIDIGLEHFATVLEVIAIAAWVFIMYDLITAPEVDDEGNIKSKDKEFKLTLKNVATLSTEELKELESKINDYDRMSDEYSNVICHATGGILSYTNYRVDTVNNLIDETQSSLYYGIVKEDLLNIMKDRSDSAEDILEDIKQYIEEL